MWSQFLGNANPLEETEASHSVQKPNKRTMTVAEWLNKHRRCLFCTHHELTRIKDSVDYARTVIAENVRFTIEVEKAKSERDEAIKALEEIMLRGGNTDTCSYCGNESCHQRAGYDACNPVWTGARHFSKLHNCGECDQRWICEIEEKDCDRLYHLTDSAEREEV